MKLMLALCLISLFSLPAYSEDLDSCNKNHPEWMKCQMDTDCILVADPCGTIQSPTSKVRHKETTECNRLLGAALSCVDPRLVNVKNLKASCEENTCVVGTVK